MNWWKETTIIGVNDSAISKGWRLLSHCLFLRLFCFFKGHKWGPWKADDDQKFFMIIAETRECKRCYELESREERSMWLF